MSALRVVASGDVEADALEEVRIARAAADRVHSRVQAQVVEPGDMVPLGSC